MNNETLQDVYLSSGFYALPDAEEADDPHKQ